MKKDTCAICGAPPVPEEKLCRSCDEKRLRAAHLARIMAGTGLTWSNVKAFSVENWIRGARKANVAKG